LTNVIDGRQLKDMIVGAATILEQNKDALDALNVFPVPDGDTGTNMSLTMVSAAKEVAGLSDDKAADSKAVVEAMSLGALKGARGNSGVILSQIFAGFADAIKSADGGMTTVRMAEALQRGVEFAYKAVMKPKEGTILTVAKSVAEAAAEIAQKSDNFYKQLLYVIKEGEKTLRKTPDMLPVLKEAGVVDAGGAGFLVLLAGFKAVINGDAIDTAGILDGDGTVDFSNVVGNEAIEFGYCTEFFIKNLFPETQERDIDTFRNQISKIGDSVIVVGGLDLVKTHVHTNEPGLALQYAQILGELSHIKIDNMREQHRELSEVYEVEGIELPVAEEKQVAVITVSTGYGIRAIFADWQVDGFVEGGQSMNPSTADILKAINACNSKNVIVLPNNKNIILAAEQAAEMSDKNVYVVETKSIPQGIAAAVSYDPERTAEENIERMNKAIRTVKTGQITNAVRNTMINGNEIHKGELIGIADGQIIANGKDIGEIVKLLLINLTDEDSEMITVYYGEDVAESAAQRVFNIIQKDFGNYDAEMVNGGQPVYQYLISVE